MATLLTAIVAIAAIVQAAAAVIVSRLTRRLVSVTNEYAETTEKLLKLNREQLERDWRPDLRIAGIHRSGSEQVFIRVANLAKPPALVKQLKIGTGGRSNENHPPQGVESYPRTFIVAGGQIYEQVRIESELGQYRQKYSPPPVPPTRSPWQSSMNIALVYDSAGKENQTLWFDCSIDFEDNKVTNIGRA